MAKTESKKSPEELAAEVTGVVPEFVNKPGDRPTLVVDGLSGLAVSLHQVKIYLAEHHPVEGKVLGRTVGALVIPNDQFLKIADSIATAAEQIRSMADDEAE